MNISNGVTGSHFRNSLPPPPTAFLELAHPHVSGYRQKYLFDSGLTDNFLFPGHLVHSQLFSTAVASPPGGPLGQDLRQPALSVSSYRVLEGLCSFQETLEEQASFRAASPISPCQQHPTRKPCTFSEFLRFGSNASPL
jgi:hypothetical protein